MEIEIINCEQTTAEWHSHRAGIPTASMFKTVMAKGRGNEPSKTRHEYLMRLVAEKMTGVAEETFKNDHMIRGQELEPEARSWYQFETNNEVEKVGFIKRIDLAVGCSPDGLISNDGLLEIKTKLPALHLDVLVSSECPSEHLAQIQGCLWVTGRQWCDFVSYCYVPEGFEHQRLPGFIKRVYRDEEYIERIADAVKTFNEELNALTVQLMDKYLRRA